MYNFKHIRMCLTHWLDHGCVTGITDIEIHFLQIKFTAIGVYLDAEVVGHLQQWKGKSGKDLAEDDDFFEALISGRLLFLLV